MSIRIDEGVCTGCGLCVAVCPGSLITAKGLDGRAVINRPEDCWGCASCLKECAFGAISYFLGADIGGNGATMRVIVDGNVLDWVLTMSDGHTERIKVRRDEPNSY
ncbi:MAG: ferredoxin family protein [Synergistaceae bacterium]|jgi:adenylylsulfate reductase subunit B|nr:ferredoxin family protein [Synergistaceae bacterium]